MRPGRLAESTNLAFERLTELVQHGRRRLPVVEDRTVVGMLSRRDVLRLFDRPDRALEADVVAHLANPLWSPADAEMEIDVRDGVVTATGTVLHPMDRRVVEAAIWAMPGVVAVDALLEARVLGIARPAVGGLEPGEPSRRKLSVPMR